jgi:anti-anti-sigma factor
MLPALRRPAAETAIVFPVLDDVFRESSVPQGLLPLTLAAGAAALHLDLAAVEAPTAAGLGRVVTLYRELRTAGVGLVLLNASRELDAVFQATGLTKLLDVRSTATA